MNETIYITEFGFNGRNSSKLNVWFGANGERFFRDMLSNQALWICKLDDSLTVEEQFPGLNFNVHKADGYQGQHRVYIPADEETAMALKLLLT